MSFHLIMVIHVHLFTTDFTCTQGKLPQRPSALPRLPPVTLEEWERFRDDWGRINTESELKFKARVFYGVSIEYMYAIVPVVQYPSLVGGGVWVAGSRNFLKVERRYNYS